ncbi:hypothetical protein AVEN_162453-1 [Araneus ventricosus]|uniref:Uncharacterized protein n=1 Tax=Araneus ventricosus TaxID=182803 RepID=A0A4Y2MU86_ARAVE|nr:hypothetical protein AVEN_162453-1 [Araneus ventricosus]
MKAPYFANNFKPEVRPEVIRVRSSPAGYEAPYYANSFKPEAQRNGLWLARVIGPPTALISKPNLPSKEASRLRPAFVAAKRKFLDRLARWESVKVQQPHIYGGSSVESGFEPGTFQPRSRDLTTKLARPTSSAELGGTVA